MLIYQRADNDGLLLLIFDGELLCLPEGRC